jgi:hypothetical protein
MNLFKTRNEAEHEARLVADFYTETVVVLEHYDGFELEMYPEWARTEKEPLVFIDPRPKY